MSLLENANAKTLSKLKNQLQFSFKDLDVFESRKVEKIQIYQGVVIISAIFYICLQML